MLTCREEPPFAGPAAAIAAGLAALEQDDAARRATGSGAPDPRPGVRHAARGRGGAVPCRRGGRSRGLAGRDGVMALSADGRKQPLVGFYGTAALQRSAADAARRGALENASVFALLASLEVRAVRVPSGSTDDVDTWDDASALGVTGRIQGNDPGVRPGAPQLNSTLEANGEKPG